MSAFFITFASMINTVRNTVLSIISKDNRGYITPEEFNLFARQAQLEIFEDYFYQYSNNVNKRNARLHNSGYSDIPERLEQVIDTFTVDDVLTYNGITYKFYAPGTNPAQPEEPLWYKINRLTYNNSKEIEKIGHGKILNLLSSKLTAPTVTYPVYTIDEAGITVYPGTITSNVTINYVRYPNDPKWTYISLSGGEPVFNASATDYQDFELPISDAPMLVVKILQYAGVSIRENDVVQIMDNEEITEAQKKA